MAGRLNFPGMTIPSKHTRYANNRRNKSPLFLEEFVRRKQLSILRGDGD